MQNSSSAAACPFWDDPQAAKANARQLLMGMFALKLGLLRGDQVVAALDQFASEPRRPFEQHLAAAGLPSQDIHALERMVNARFAPGITPKSGPESDSANGSEISLEMPKPNLDETAISNEYLLQGDGKNLHNDVTVAVKTLADGYRSAAVLLDERLNASERYVVLRQHAEGGLGRVCLARDTHLNREVAFKEIKPEFSNDNNNQIRFLLEAEITGCLEHPGIVPVYGLGKGSDGRPFYAMRFIRGHDLRQAIGELHSGVGPPNSFELRKMLGRFVAVCQTIEFAHAKGVLHRDLKPANIMLGKHGETLVVDWGLAKVQGQKDRLNPSVESDNQPISASSIEATQYGSALGTPAYMSPEQAEGNLDAIGPASDVYGLGATLYHLLTGQPSVAGTNNASILKKVRNGEWLTPRQVKAWIPKPLEAICLRAMRHKPEDRYATAQALANDLERYLADEHVSAYAEPLSQRARRWVRKHPTLTISGCVLIMAGLLGSVGFAAQSRLHGSAIVQKNSELGAANELLNIKNGDLNKANSKLLRAQQAAEDKRVEAERERDQNKRVLEFLVAAFKRTNPNQDGYQVTVASVLKQAVEAIQKDEGLDPLSRVQLLEAIAVAFNNLGLWVEEPPLREEILKLHSKERSPNDKEVLLLQHELAISYLLAGRPQEALPLSQHAYDGLKEALGESAVETLDALMNLASSYEALGDYPESMRLHLRNYEIALAAHGEKGASTLRAKGELAGAYVRSGRTREAVPLMEEVLKSYQETRAPDDREVLLLMNNLAQIYWEIGNPAEACSLLEKALPLCLAKLGPRHAQTLSITNNLGNVYVTLGDLEKAEPLMKESVEIQIEVLGLKHKVTLTALNNLGQLYMKQRKLPEALAHFTRAMEGMQAEFGETHPDALTMKNNMAAIHWRLGEFGQAIVLLEQVLAAQRTKLGNDHPSTLVTMGNLAINLRDANRYEEAVQLFEEANSKPRDPTLRWILAEQLKTYIKMKEVTKASAILEADIANARQANPPESAIMAEALVNDATQFILLGVHVRAGELLGEAAAILEKTDPDNWLYFKARSLLGICTYAKILSTEGAEARQPLFEEAQAHMLKGYDGLQAHAAEIPEEMRANELSGAPTRLMQLYELWEKPEEAAKWRARINVSPRPELE